MNLDGATALPLLSDPETFVWTPTGGERGLGALSTARGNLPLRRVSASAHIEGLFVELEVEQTFANEFDEPLEAIYIFPLPERMALHSMSLQVGDRDVRAEVQERGGARREYQKAVEQGKPAALLEEDRPGVFTLQVGAIPPGEEATVRATLVGTIPCTNREATFRLPLVTAPRYVPGAPLPGAWVGAGESPDTTSVPDASRLSPPVLLPGNPFPVRLSIRVFVDPAGMPASEFRSSLHAIRESRNEAGGVCITLAHQERLDRDFVLRWKLTHTEAASQLLISPDRDGSWNGTFALTIVPPPPAPGARRPRDVAFVVDHSASTAGWRLAGTKSALRRLVGALAPSDRMTVLAGGEVCLWPAGFNPTRLSPAGAPEQEAAINFLEHLEPRGGGDLTAPLRFAATTLSAAAALSPSNGTDRERVVVLVSGGRIANEAEILALFPQKERRIRVLAVGVDPAANGGFLQQLAEVSGGGVCELVESPERLEEAMERILHLAVGPLVTGVGLHPVDFGATQTAPARLPPLFADTPLVVYGRYSGSPAAPLEIEGTLLSGGAWRTTAAVRRTEHRAVAACWARTRLRELEDRYALGRFGSQSKEDFYAEVVRLSIEQQVLCRFTAFGAVDRSGTLISGGRMRSIVQPVEPVAEPPPTPTPAPGPTSGPTPGSGVWKRVEAAPGSSIAGPGSSAMTSSGSGSSVMGSSLGFSSAPPPNPNQSPSLAAKPGSSGRVSTPPLGRPFVHPPTFTSVAPAAGAEPCVPAASAAAPTKGVDRSSTAQAHAPASGAAEAAPRIEALLESVSKPAPALPPVAAPPPAPTPAPTPAAKKTEPSTPQPPTVAAVPAAPAGRVEPESPSAASPRPVRSDAAPPIATHPKEKEKASAEPEGGGAMFRRTFDQADGAPSSKGAAPGSASPASVSPASAPTPAAATSVVSPPAAAPVALPPPTAPQGETSAPPTPPTRAPAVRPATTSAPAPSPAVETPKIASEPPSQAAAPRRADEEPFAPQEPAADAESAATGATNGGGAAAAAHAPPSSWGKSDGVWRPPAASDAAAPPPVAVAAGVAPNDWQGPNAAAGGSWEGAAAAWGPAGNPAQQWGYAPPTAGADPNANAYAAAWAAYNQAAWGWNGAPATADGYAAWYPPQAGAPGPQAAGPWQYYAPPGTPEGYPQAAAVGYVPAPPPADFSAAASGFPAGGYAPAGYAAPGYPAAPHAELPAVYGGSPPPGGVAPGSTANTPHVAEPRSSGATPSSVMAAPPRVREPVRDSAPPAEAAPAEAPIDDLRATRVDPIEPHATNIRSTEARNTEVRSTEVRGAASPPAAASPRPKRKKKPRSGPRPSPAERAGRGSKGRKALAQRLERLEMQVRVATVVAGGAAVLALILLLLRLKG